MCCDLKAKILDKSEIATNKGCYLCSINLYDYLESLEVDFDKFDVQRKIVNNKYLDSLARTVLTGEHIPIITLVVLNEKFEIKVEEEKEVEKFRILDGLQRTWRLNAIKKLSDWLLTNFETNESIEENFINGNMRSLSKEKRQEIIECGVADFKQAKNIAKQIIDTVGIKNVKKCLEEKVQWFEIWYGLDKDEIVNKMLLLNAGHKSVTMRHQVELLYYDWFEIFSSAAGINVIRDKDADSPVKFVLEREIKTYRFSDLVMATIAFVDGKYKRVQSAFVEDVYLNTDNDERLGQNVEFYRGVMEFIGKIDSLLYDEYDDAGRIWFGRENNIEAFMGAVGKYCWEKCSRDEVKDALNSVYQKICNKIELLNLQDFDSGKAFLSSSKINIGQTTKEVVYTVFNEVLNDNMEYKIDWKEEFERVGGV